MKSFFFRTAPFAAVLAGTFALAGCAVEPSATILSRLPDNQPGAAGPVHTLTPDERKRYDTIDRQVLSEQNQAIAAEAAARAWSYSAPPPITYYGGYYGGGWGNGWNTGFSYGYPGWWW
ncbi:hypothetical protein [Burkholderia alba]|uniref:hypothetical protein n=1 Tax=Burkholderia alba TaxID=2683677 RepID=UPI002B061A14|nr:hypothetical protein [Burkholderia alba]